MSDDTPKFDPSTELWPTPTVGDSRSARNSTARRQKLPPTGIHKGNTLTDAVTIASIPSTSSAEASLASHSPSPGSGAARQMTVSSGRRCFVLLSRSGPVGSWLKTCLASSRFSSTKRFLIWKPKGTKRGRLYFQLVPSIPRRSDPGYSLWPTPKSNPSGPDYARTNRPRSGGDDLAASVARLYPTPTARDHKGKGHSGQLGTEIGGQLNPTWVEWLMGFPLGWTALSASATPSSRRSQRSSDE